MVQADKLDHFGPPEKKFSYDQNYIALYPGPALSRDDDGFLMSWRSSWLQLERWNKVLLLQVDYERKKKRRPGNTGIQTHNRLYKHSSNDLFYLTSPRLKWPVRL